jgi:superoxide reductase
MTEQLQVYKCEVCGIVVEVLEGGAGEPVCCGQPMTLMPERTADEGREKHVPVVERTPDGIRVKVGSVPHPMERKHFIQWIEVLADGRSHRRFLAPGRPPEADFAIRAENATVRELCNLHGLWKAENV